jgi:hypothetical protein
MEFFDKYTWVAPISATLSIWFIFFLEQTHFTQNSLILLGTLMCSFFVFPCMLRSVICFNWRPAPAIVVDIEDLSKFHAGEMGVLTFTVQFKVHLEYVAHNRIFKGSINTSADELKNLYVLYYHPKTPTTYTYNKGMSLLSLGLLYDLVLLLILGYVLPG